VTAAVRSVSLRGPTGRLEALVNEGVAGDLSQARYAALICHPHPLGGGTMHNKVVYHAMKVLSDPKWGFGWPVLRFNFRGVGLSAGVYDGRAEADDVLAAIDWLKNTYHRPLVVAGFSFGAAMALSACCAASQTAASVCALALLGLPIHSDNSEYQYPCLEDCCLPKLFLSGEQDQFAPAAELKQVVTSAAAPKQLVLLPHADHFFTGQLEPMQRALAGWLKERLP
jgi:uncharacterized protein